MNIMKKAFMMITLLCSMLLASCNKENQPKTREREPIILTKSQNMVNESVLEFSWKFCNEIARVSDKQANMLISPYSMDLALSMLMQGAEGETLSQIKSAICVDNLSKEEIGQYFQTMSAALKKADSKVKYFEANSLWKRDGLEAKPTFRESLNTYYYSEAFQITTTDAINSWCSQKTNGKIKNVIDKIDDNIKYFLINALCFEGSWKKEFKSVSTDKFTRASGQKVNAQFMSLSDYIQYVENDNLQMVSVPYGNGAFSMSLIKPKSTSAMSLAENMTKEQWQDLLESSYTENVILRMPKFTVDFSAKDNIMKAMMNLGMTDAFTPLADFSEMFNVDTFVAYILQKTKIEVDEKGTKATAVTVVSGLETASGPGKAVTLDSPFIYVISEYSTGAILFTGVLNTL